MAITTTKKYTGQEGTSAIDGRLRIEEGNNRIIMHDGNTNRVLFGRAPNGDYLFAITVPDKDVIEELQNS